MRISDGVQTCALPISIGGYLWATLRRDGGSVVDAAVLFLVAYVILGVLGASIQIVALPLLAELHKSADPAIRSGSEMAWLLVVNIAQRAVWWMEGPTFALWAIPTGLVMRAQSDRKSTRLNSSHSCASRMTSSA